MLSTILFQYIYLLSILTDNIKYLQADSGGSVTSNGEIYGIISLPREGEFGIYDLHTKVFSYLSFIQAIVGKALEQ
jgi:hypothetical protein